MHERNPHSHQRGQAIVLFALALVTIVAGVAVVVDGGYAYSQRRVAQNAADFAAMAGTRIVGQKLTGKPAGSGTAQNVADAVNSTLAANGSQLVDARYVAEDGRDLGSVVSAASIPNGAFGVVVEARTEWQPFLLGVLGISDWAANATAIAKTPGKSLGGGVLPIGIKDTTFDDLSICPVTGLQSCIDNLTSGHLNIPGGFGWLKFGLGGKCGWTQSLGMVNGGCQTDKPFLDSQIGPPGDTHGCCGPVEQPGSVDFIGSLTGNEWGELSYYVDNKIPVWVPIWDTAHGNGANAYYHIVGFGPLFLTGDNEHAKWLEGAAITAACALPGHKYCAGPGGAFTIDVTGEVQLIR